MRVYPAIDIMGGEVVRLKKGVAADKTVYASDVAQLVREYERQGAALIHVVDLDAAFAGRCDYNETIAAITAAANVSLQIGGGIRTISDIENRVAAGASRVVLGTIAVTDPELMKSACRKFPDTIVVAVDANDGKVAIKGWTETSTTDAIDLARIAADAGACAILYTDIARDGVEVGPNVERTEEIQRAVSCEVIASGGVGSLEHLQTLHEAGIAAVVVGRALLEGRFSLADALAVCAK